MRLRLQLGQHLLELPGICIERALDSSKCPNLGVCLCPGTLGVKGNKRKSSFQRVCATISRVHDFGTVSQFSDK